jgi:hypothetical protein
MAFPDKWALRQEQLSWSQQSGWVVTQNWRGPSGALKATRDAWLAEWVTVYGSYVSLAFNDSLPMLDGEAVCEATVGYGSNEKGEPIPDTSDEYGLLKRQWTLGAVDVQRSIRDNPSTERLANRWREWPSEIRSYITMWKETQQLYLDKWKVDGYPVGGPTRPLFRIPEPPQSTNYTVEELDLAYTLADRILTDETPTWTTTDYTLRKTETVTSWSTMHVIHDYKNQYLAWAALAELEPTLPGTGLIQTGDLEALIWLKKVPEVTVTSGGNYELSQDYVGTIRPAANSKQDKDLLYDYGAIVESIP